MSFFKAEKLIEAASEEADPLAGLGRLREQLGQDFVEQAVAAKDAGRPKGLHLIAGLYLRSGGTDRAAELLLPSVRPAAPADAVIVDPDYTFGGHSHSFDRYYLDAARRAGLAPLFAYTPRQVPEGDALRGPAVELPTMRVRDLSPRRFKDKDLAALNQLFAVLFDRALPRRRPPLVIAPTASHTFVEGLAQYLADRQGGEVSLVLGIHDTHWAAPSASDEYLRRPFRRALERLDRLPARVLLVTETSAIADGLIAALQRETVVCPNIGGFAEPIPPRPGDAEGIVVAFVGHTQATRGAGLVPEIALRTLAAGPPGMRWKAQLDLGKLGPLLSDAGRAALTALAAEPRFTRLDTNLPTAEYRAVLASVDVMVNPFTGEYRTRGSGIVTECFRAGIVQVLPEGPLTAEAEAIGAGHVAFAEHEAGAVANAVLTAVEQLETLRAKSAAAAARLRSDNPALARIEAFIAEART